MGDACEPIERRSFDTAALFEMHPPVLTHPNKCAVYEIACPEGCLHGGQLDYSRWRQMQLPGEINAAAALGCVEAREDVYDYTPVLDAPNAVEWHVNFADPDIFFAYGSGLFAQDEMQVAEHPALGALREALVAAEMPALTTEDGRATPVLIKGIERRCRIATDRNETAGRPLGLYGNEFATANPEAVRRATSRIEPPTITNLIAMAAPSGGFGVYTRDEIEHILITAYTGFRAAVIEEDSGPVGVHTGFWGCGAFGGNRELMALLQVCAAGMAGLDRLIFHTFDAEGSAALDAALMRIQDQFSSPALAPIELMEQLAAMDFEWGLSDGN